MAIAQGHIDRPLAALEKGARCTWFLPAPEGRSARKRWIAGALAPLGALVVDAGAARALGIAMSMLLPSPEIDSPMYAVAPWPMDCIVTTAATPMTIPKVVRSERILLRNSADSASEEVMGRFKLSSSGPLPRGRRGRRLPGSRRPRSSGRA